MVPIEDLDFECITPRLFPVNLPLTDLYLFPLPLASPNRPFGPDTLTLLHWIDSCFGAWTCSGIECLYLFLLLLFPAP